MYLLKKWRTAFAICLMLGVVAAAPRPAAAQTSKWVKVINRSYRPIYHLYISSASTNQWGPDQLSLFETIGPNRYRTFAIPWYGCWVDLRAVLSDGTYTERYGANVCGGLDWTVYDADDE